MKKLHFIIFASIFVCLTSTVFGQAKKPTLMILPSDNWCEQREFMTEYDNQGQKVRVPNYKLVFQYDQEIGQVISKIGSLMIDRGFPLKDAEQEIKAIESRSAEDNMTSSTTSGSSISESPLDKLRNKAKADITIQIWWKKNTKPGQPVTVSFILEAFDAYTSKRIAASSGTSAPNNTDVTAVLLENAVLANIDPFAAQLQKHFDEMAIDGREVMLTVKRWNSWDKTLESEIDNKEINDYINEWMQKNTVKGRFSATPNENVTKLDQVRIPMYDSNNNAMDARQFAKGLQKYLKGAPFNFEVKLMTRGLGEAVLILGEK